MSLRKEGNCGGRNECRDRSLRSSRITMKRTCLSRRCRKLFLFTQTALSKAALLAQGLDCVAGEIRLVHVGPQRTAPVIETPHWPGWSYNNIVRQGDVVDGIAKAEHEWRPDLMVLATQGHLDFLDALRGSTTERVLRAAHCPVLAVPVRRLPPAFGARSIPG